MDGVTRFFEIARRRHTITLKREMGRPPPWTDDPIFQRYKFTNVYRELDRTTIWFAHNIRNNVAASPNAMLATAGFRWFNRIAAGEAINQGALTHWMLTGEIEEVRKAILKAIPSGPWVTGAYIIKTPDGMPKLDGVLWAMKEFWRNKRRLGSLLLTPLEAGFELLGNQGKYTLEEVHNYLSQFQYLGHFMAYEIVSDLRWTSLLHKAPDIMTWANPGPGAKRGLGRVFANDPKRAAGRQKMLEEMRALLEFSRQTDHWPMPSLEWPPWEMREVEHWLCESDKYARTFLGEGRPRGSYP